jgi:hypothetical protein
MAQTATPPVLIPTEKPLYKSIFWVVAIGLFILMPILSVAHGQSGDEWTLILYGNDIYDYFFKGSLKALNYDLLNWKQMEGVHYYGGLFDFTVTYLHKTFAPGVNELTFRHVFNALLGAGLFLFTGLLAKEIAGWRAGLLALIFIAISPRLFGESMNNPKDIPFAFANFFFLYYLVRFLKSWPAERWKYALLLGLGFGLAMGFRVGGFLLLAYFWLFVGAFYLWNAEFRRGVNVDFTKSAKQLIGVFAILAVLGYIIGIAAWPWALQEPLSRPFAALSEMTNRQIFMPVLYEGEMIPNDEVPWYYTFKWIFISSPVVILLLFVLSVFLTPRLLKTYGKFPVFLLFFTLFFPPLYAVYKHSVLYDTWRHFFFIYPPLVILAALAAQHLFVVTTGKSTQWVVLGILAVGLALPLAFTVRNHPNEYVYFNELQGGVAGAYGVYDQDYYQNSGKQGALWIQKDAEKSGLDPVIIRSNLNGIDKYFSAEEQKRFQCDYRRYEIRDTADWDYYITYSRYQPVQDLENGLWPPANAAHIIRVDGVPISAVLKRKSKEGVLGFRNLEAQNYEGATTHFGAYLKVDPYNNTILPIYVQLLAQQGRGAEATTLLQQAKAAQPANPEWDALLRQIK